MGGDSRRKGRERNGRAMDRSCRIFVVVFKKESVTQRAS